ncbi:hypothetical protein DRN76_01650 [Methanosarcinales archaeon]|nr:MAG: hypothetical protein DRN76_01650 [Methanosarcinales archaeon]
MQQGDRFRKEDIRKLLKQLGKYLGFDANNRDASEFIPSVARMGLRETDMRVRGGRGGSRGRKDFVGWVGD